MSRERRDEFGDWKHVRCLGSGGNGEVHLWQNKKSREKLAVKSMKFPPDRNDQKEMTRWNQEIAFAKQIRHVNIIHALTAESSFAHFLKNRYPPEPLVMEYCEKGDLRKKLNKIENLNGMAEAEVRNVVQCLHNAVTFLHSKHITHRDIKPENLVIKEVNGCEVYKLTDLGFARELTSTIEASHVGTFEYFAPEVISEPSYSNTVDYWSMGIIAFEVICGTRPFLPGCGMPEVIRRIKEKSNDVIAITKSPENKEIKNHKRIFDQNHISSCLRLSFERWFRSAFSVKPRERSSKEVDVLLSMQILTVFCLHNFRLYSYVISEKTSREGFLKTLALDTGIPLEDIVIILPPENTCISRFTQNNQPKELYIKDFYDKPMVYCTTDKDTLKDSCFNAGVSETLSNALTENTVKNRKHAIEVAKHIMFYVQTQARHCTMFLEGLLSYAAMVDDWISKYQNKVEEMKSSFSQLQGARRLYLAQKEHAKHMIAEKNISDALEDNSARLNDRFEKCGELFMGTLHRFKSVLRRSKATYADLNQNYESFSKKVNEYCDLKIPFEIYNKFRDGSEESLAATRKEMFKYFTTFQENIYFMHSAQIINIQKSISEIHEEFELILKLVDALLEKQVNMLKDVEQLARDLNKSLWEIADKSVRGTKDEPNIPDLDGILTGLNGGTAYGSSGSTFPICNGSNINGIDDWSLMSLSEDGQAIVVENERLCERLENMLKTRVFDDR